MKLLIAAGLLATTLMVATFTAPNGAAKPKLGAIETVTEVSSGLEFLARIDTGAESCSIHCEAMHVIDPAAHPKDNVGKRIRFLVKNKRRQSRWLESVIVARVRVRTSEQAEHRYKVELTFRCRGVEKAVPATLNDRGEMRYPILIGRNFLRDQFVVDVALRKKS
jgi:hypothetical protein